MRDKEKMSKYSVQLLGVALGVPLESQVLLLMASEFN